MWIQHKGIADPESSLGTVAIRNRHTNGEQVAFNPDTGKANAKREIAEALVAWRDGIVPVDTDTDTSSSD